MAKNQKEHKTSIGGSAVMEGVMMRGPEKMAVAVRKSDGEIVMDLKDVKPPKKRMWLWRLPVIRGCINFFESMVTSVKALMFSADCMDIEEEKPSKFDKWLEKVFGEKLKTVVIYFAVILSVLMSVGLFILLPTGLVSLIGMLTENRVVLSASEGVIRILIFLGYLIIVSFMPDIKRVFQYHGAEHKTIACYEAGEPLTVENARTKCRLHPRCGTSFLLIVMVISIIAFSFLSWDKLWIRMVTRLALMPVVAGVSYEIIKFAGRHDNWFTKILSWPGKMLQKITTKEPDDSQLEVAIASMEAVIPENQDEAKW